MSSGCYTERPLGDAPLLSPGASELVRLGIRYAKTYSCRAVVRDMADPHRRERCAAVDDCPQVARYVASLASRATDIRLRCCRHHAEWIRYDLGQDGASL